MNFCPWSGTETAVTSSSAALAGKVALISGASRGIGNAIAAAFVQAEATVYITARNASLLNAAARSIGAIGLRCDHTDKREVETLFHDLRERSGKLDLLVNNAGSAHSLANVEQLDPQVWSDVINANLTSMFLTCHYALPLLRSGGIIVNNLSIAARSHFAGMSAYVAAKHGALGLTNTLREELRPRGIRVLALLPGATSTDLWNQFWENAPRDQMMSPASVAQIVLRAVTLPPQASADEIVISPSGGPL